VIAPTRWGRASARLDPARGAAERPAQ